MPTRKQSPAAVEKLFDELAHIDPSLPQRKYLQRAERLTDRLTAAGADPARVAAAFNRALRLGRSKLEEGQTSALRTKGDSLKYETADAPTPTITPPEADTVTYRRVVDDGPWLVSIDLGVHGGRLVVESLTIEANRLVDLPTGGVTARILRDIRVAELVEEARDSIARQNEIFKLAGSDQGPVAELFRMKQAVLSHLADTTPEPRGRRGRDDIYYLPWAVWYAAKLASGSTSPVSEVAADRGVHRGQVRDRISVARRRGLLTDPPPEARAGGELTDKARALLAAMNEAEG